MMPLTMYVRLFIIAKAFYILLICSLLFSKEDREQVGAELTTGILSGLVNFLLSSMEMIRVPSCLKQNLSAFPFPCLQIVGPRPLPRAGRIPPTPSLYPLAKPASLCVCCVFLGSTVPLIPSLTPGDSLPGRQRIGTLALCEVRLSE